MRIANFGKIHSSSFVLVCALLVHFYEELTLELRCLTASNSITAAAIATFNDSVRALIGIETLPLANWLALALAP